MDRILCDICGSEYSGTAEVCPICGYPRQGDEKLSVTTEQALHEKVRGGRFSSKNVRRRHQQAERSDRGLWITIILLLIAIALVTAYIVMRFWGGWGGFTGGSQLPATTTLPTTTAAPVETTVPCASLSLNVAAVELEEEGQQAVLAVQMSPDNTTDQAVFTSSDPGVAQVTDKGVITAVGPGEATITVTCGAVTETCSVSCRFQEETMAPAETAAPTEPARLILDHVDASLFQVGESFTIRVTLGDASVSRSQVTWSTSDPAVATVENGVVTGVGPGTASITAKYEGQKAVCVVRCQFKDGSWRASSTDVTLSVGESFRLYVTNGAGEKADVVWSVDREGIVSVDGSTVTAQQSGTVTLFTIVEDVKLWCVVRVK